VRAGGGTAGRMRTAIHDDEGKGFKLPHGTGCC
jgi:carbon starvation protein